VMSGSEAVRVELGGGPETLYRVRFEEPRP
jgi:hypothetical protein